MKRFFQIVHDEEKREASIDIYGDITSWEWYNSDVSAHTIHTEINGLDVDRINVYINSCGGEVFEALAIYSTLKKHKATIHTYCDGIAASAASVIFCAGDERTISNVGLLMIHNAWSWASGDANALRKAADDLEKCTQPSIEVYKGVCNLPEDEIKAMMDAETFISATEALEFGFATDIANANEDGLNQSAMACICQKIKDVSSRDFVDEIKRVIREAFDNEFSNKENIENKKDDPENSWSGFFY